jgi:hypothetical protein
MKGEMMNDERGMMNPGSRLRFSFITHHSSLIIQKNVAPVLVVFSAKKVAS